MNIIHFFHFCFFFFFVFVCSLDKLLGAITAAAERNNRERFSAIVEGLENHEALQLQVGSFCHDSLELYFEYLYYTYTF